MTSHTTSAATSAMTTAPPLPSHTEVVVIGGGPAGLQAALTLGRVHREVLVLDSGRYRNDPATHAHNMLTRDGTPPSELRAVARRQLEAYPTVTVCDEGAESVAPDGSGFVVTTAAGEVRARGVVLATGLRDVLPDVAGLAPQWGTTVAQCPFCHGHELSGRPVAVLGSHAHVGRVAFLLERIASHLTVLTDGGELDAGLLGQLAAAGVEVRSEPLVEVVGRPDGVRVRFAAGPDVDLGGIFIATTAEQGAPFAAQLGLALLPSGCVEVDAFGRTSVAGVYAAGDLAHTAELPGPMPSVLGAAHAGMMAAVTAVHDLVAADHPAPALA